MKCVVKTGLQVILWEVVQKDVRMEGRGYNQSVQDEAELSCFWTSTLLAIQRLMTP